MEINKIQTVSGNIPSDELGFCHSHEHVAIAPGYVSGINPDLCIDEPARTLCELEQFYKAGGRALVDAQPGGCGRQADILEALSKKSHVSIIASTGFHKTIFYPEDHWIFAYSETKLRDFFLTELRSGMFVNCDIAKPKKQINARAGQIKTALDKNDFNPLQEKLFSAAAAAAAGTGAPMMIHVEKGSDPLALSDFLQERSVSPSQMIFCHMDRMIPQIEKHKLLCNQGSFLEYDTIARPKYHDDISEVGLIREMVESGYEDNLLMGLDVTRVRLPSYGGSVGLTYILDKFIPLLKNEGFPESILNKFFTVNPAKAFSPRIPHR